jgi:hypothetical protein
VGRVVAEMERKFILERQRTGIEAATVKGGVYKGRKPSVPVEEVRRLHGEGKAPGGDCRGSGRVPYELLAGAEDGSGLNRPRGACLRGRGLQARRSAARTVGWGVGSPRAASRLERVFPSSDMVDAC